MKERPIIFSGDMVRAILAGRKTQTRRVIKCTGTWSVCNCDGEEWPGYVNDLGDWELLRCPFGQPGDRLWVRETFWFRKSDGITAFADGTLVTHPTSLRGAKPIWATSPPEDDWPNNATSLGFAKRSPIHMPRWASRITLEVVSVRVERLQDIREEDAKAEGFEPYGRGYPELATCRWAFGEYWDQINANRGHPWESSPWVWAVEFRKV